MDRTWKEMRAHLSLPPGQMAISLMHYVSSSGFWIHLYFFMLACWTFEWKWSREYAAIGTTHHWWATKCQRPTTHNLPNEVKELALKQHKVEKKLVLVVNVVGCVCLDKFGGWYWYFLTFSLGWVVLLLASRATESPQMKTQLGVQCIRPCVSVSVWTSLEGDIFIFTLGKRKNITENMSWSSMH